MFHMGGWQLNICMNIDIKYEQNNMARNFIHFIQSTQIFNKKKYIVNKLEKDEVRERVCE